LQVSLVAVPDAVISTLAGVFDVMNGVALMAPAGAAVPFRVEIVGEAAGPLKLASRLPIEVQRPISEVDFSDIVIVPSVLLGSKGWAQGRYPQLVSWLGRMHQQGALLCSACSGNFLLAETGALRRQRCHRAFRVRACLQWPLSAGHHPSGTRAGHFGSA
jgi:transcriptional regulator GlxA family with amidase domain